jgi:Zn-finger nucleic acid-binding protein
MRPFQAGRVELDRCTFCRGLWFDGGELEQVLGKKVSAEVTTGMKTSRNCPACQKPLEPAVLGGLRVESCASCRGIFLDEGELVALNDGKKVTIQQQAPPPEAKVRDDVTAWLDSLGV